MQQCQPLCHQFGGEKIDARGVASRPAETSDQTNLDRIIAYAKDDQDGGGRSLHRADDGRRATWDGNDHHPTADQVRRQFGHAVISIFRPAVFDRNVLSFYKADFVKIFAEGGQIEHRGVERAKPEKPDHWHRWLLRTRRARPRRRAAERG